MIWGTKKYYIYIKAFLKILQINITWFKEDIILTSIWFYVRFDSCYRFLSKIPTFILHILKTDFKVFSQNTKNSFCLILTKLSFGHFNIINFDQFRKWYLGVIKYHLVSFPLSLSFFLIFIISLDMILIN